ncbi:MAG: phosphotransferase [Candidatus Omnitrophica bacterium]|nr:phosphotransferase [Candidatus Omnitrophota bacterium]
MDLRRQLMESFPDFPFLEPNSPDSAEACLRKVGWLKTGERVLGVERAGEGNMNLTLRVRTEQGTFIVKQARPWVEKYDHIPAPWERSTYERRFYETVARVPSVAARMPKLLFADDKAHLLVIEDFPGATDCSDVYAGRSLAKDHLAMLGRFLRVLHNSTESDPNPDFSNRDLRLLNHMHLFVVPLAEDNGLDLDRFEPGLSQAAAELQADTAYRAEVLELGKRYLSDGRFLLHGDFYPGSWLSTSQGLRIIDPEFCFQGDREYDLGVPLAHLALSRHPPEAARMLLDSYATPPTPSPVARRNWDPELVARYAGVEMMRRLIGVAQLPIPPSDGFRKDLLARSREAVLSGSLEPIVGLEARTP